MDRPIRLLVVDDDAPTRRLLSAALCGEGVYEVVTARSGDEAIGIYQGSPDFDLIVSDLTMPGMPGLEFISRLRALKCVAPILVLSSMQTDQSVARALETGADDYLQKPVDLRELRRAVAFLVDQSAERKHAEIADEDAEVETPPPVPPVKNLESGTFVELTALTDSPQVERFQRFVDRLLSSTLAEKERRDLHLALEEIVRNANEWGNQSDRTKTVRLSYCLMPDRITFRVEDEGAGFDPSTLNDPSADPIAHIETRRASGKRMGGWGIFLTRKVMDEVTYNRKGNVVFLTKYLRRGGLTAMIQGTQPTSQVALEPAPTPPVPPSKPRRNTRMLRKTTRLLRKEDPRAKEA